MSESLYTPEIDIARRNGNSKRPYLLVNRKQAKHIPTKPSEAWNMMALLGRRIGLHDDGTIVIAFAETATAIGAVVADAIGEDCFFIHSTRAQVPDGMDSVSFNEHHSHAVEHHLFGSNLFEALDSAKRIVLVDDEFTTGNTLSNAIESLKGYWNARGCVDVHAASIINRMDDSTFDSFSANGVQLHQLIESIDVSIEDAIREIAECGAQAVRGNGGFTFDVIECRGIVPDPRMGASIGDYRKSCERLFGLIEGRVHDSIPKRSRIAVIGTEECMFPSLTIGRLLERSEGAYEVLCHSTTRSPICVSDHGGYPIANGFELRSVYDAQRLTFLYNLDSYDLVLVVSDARAETLSEGADDLACAMAAYGCRRFLWVAI